MNKLPKEKRVQILTALVEGNSMRATSRMAGVSINTVTKLLVEAGCAAAAFHDRTMRSLKLRRIQCDEIWSFCYAKEKNATPEMKVLKAAGDVWTWTAIDADTKLVPSYFIGTRDAACATEFMQDVAGRLSHRVQLTTDGHKAYLSAVEDAFGSEIDYSMLVKLYGDEKPGEARYSPGVCTGCKKTPINGNPDPKHVSTSYVERQNLTMRMCMRRFTRLTNAFSKKVENLGHAVAVHFFNYNFVRCIRRSERLRRWQRASPRNPLRWPTWWICSTRGLIPSPRVVRCCSWKRNEH